MKYNRIEIRRLQLPGGFAVSFDDTDTEDRISQEEYNPNALGFFYYPKEWRVQKAFDILKLDMIKRREREIAALQEEIDAIEELALPEWVESIPSDVDNHKNTKRCVNCGKMVDITDGSSHDGCDFIWGRRGWRQLGAYDS